MLRRVDHSAQRSPWRDKPGPVAVFCAGLMAVALVLSPWPAAPLVFLTALLAATGPGRAPIGLFLRVLSAPTGFAVLGACALAFTVRWSAGPRVEVSPEGWRLGLGVAARACAAASVTILLALSVPLARQTALGRRLGLPESLVELMGLVYRMLFLLEESRETIQQTQANRLGYRTGRLALRSLALAGSALFQRSMSRARAMERGLAARGYDGQLRVLLSPDRSRPADYLVAVLVPVALAGAVLFFA